MTDRLTALRKDKTLPYLRPDGKSQVTIEYALGVPKRVHTAVVSGQHAPEVSWEVIRRDVEEEVIKAVLPRELRDKNTKYFVNPTGRFVVGGPTGDAGVTGRKIPGGYLRQRRPSRWRERSLARTRRRVDRSAAYAARYVAKNIVAAGLADRLEIQISYAIGVRAPHLHLHRDLWDKQGIGREDSGAHRPPL